MARDPYEYFRVEAREILAGLGSGILQLEKRAAPETTASLLRLAHTLKGAARVVRQGDIADHAHAIEEALAPLRDAGAHPNRELVERVLALTDQIAVDLAAIDAAPAAMTSSAPASSPAEDVARAAGADTAELDAVLDGIAQTAAQLQVLRRSAADLERARRLTDVVLTELASRFASTTSAAPAKLRGAVDQLRGQMARFERQADTALEQSARELREAHQAAERLRLRPAAELFTPLERVARDTATSIGREVTFAARGGDLRLGPSGLAIVQGALIQLVRNAVAHGIEPPAERARAGKPRAGRVEVEIARRGDRVAFACRDDGRGVDLDAVRSAAERRGLVAPGSEPLSSAEIARLLLGGGLTTARAVTQAAGRGIGLDVVRAAAERVGGEVTIETSKGRGTSLTIVVPLSLSAVEALLVESGDVSAAIAIGAVRGTVRVGSAEVTSGPDGEALSIDGSLVPFAPLECVFGRRPSARPRDGARSAVVVEAPEGLAALGVERLAGVATVIVKPLPALAPPTPIVMGAAIDADGAPRVMLDPIRLVADIVGRAKAEPAPEPELPAVVLVVDDSLTTRMMERSILESAGYDVDLATSGEEGIEKARARPYQLFLVDVEMPGMDGFTFVERTRADPALRRTPAILVTSRDSPEDRRRGMDAGASGYVVKGEFDQNALLSTIRGLVGR